MKKEFSKNTTEVFAKTLFHYVPEILKYIDEIKEPRKTYEKEKVMGKYNSILDATRFQKSH